MDHQTGENILAAIRDYIEDHGFPPSVRDIQDMTGINSTSKVQRILNELADEGYIERTPETARSIVLKEPVITPGSRT